jgi:hypothetical protein
VAAYRLARLLGIRERVPPATVRRVPLAALGRWGRGIGLIASGRRRDAVVGAAIFWMPSLQNPGLHTSAARRTWNAWLEPAARIPPEHNARAREISQVLVLDFLAANSDRWNSANIPADEHGHLVFRDNNGGFFLSELVRAGFIESIRRMPRALWNAVESASIDGFIDELARDPAGTREGRMLDRPNLEAWNVRREHLLRRMRRLLAQHGEAAILPWDD